MQLKTDRILVAFAFAILIFMCFKYLFKGKIGTNSSQHTEGGIHRWQIATTWNNNLPLLQTNIEKMLYEIETQTEHKLIISITDTPKDASGNAISLSNPLNLLHAVSKGELQGVHAAAYYWKNEIPAAVYFGSVPFGLEHGEVKQWLDNGGLKQWRELYTYYKVSAVPFSCGHTGNQMGGWFKKEIRSGADLKNLRMRIAGLGGEVMKTCYDISPSSQLPSDIFSSMQNGTLDAAEWIGPYDDYRLGLHTLNAFYYEPGWQEPNTMFEFLINQEAYEALPNDIKAKLIAVIEKYDAKIYQDYIDQNQTYHRILENKMRVPIRYFPKEVLQSLYRCTKTTLADYNNKDTTGLSKKIYDSYITFRGKTEW